MPRIAIVGAGQAGLLAAHALRLQGHDVTLYSDRTPEQFLTVAHPTGTAGRFDMALQFERELGLDHWEAKAPPVEGVHLTFSQKRGNQFVTLLGRVSRPARAIDLRLQSATWIDQLVERGGRVEVERVRCLASTRSRPATTSRWWRPAAPTSPRCSRATRLAALTARPSGCWPW